MPTIATAAASHLFDGPARPRALGIVGAPPFLGMAAGPLLGARSSAGRDGHDRQAQLAGGERVDDRDAPRAGERE